MPNRVPHWLVRSVAALALLLLPSALLAQDRWSRDTYTNGEGAHIRIGRDYTLAAGATLDEPLVVVGGSATLDGAVNEDVTVIGGSIRVGSQAVVRGELKALGGRITVDPAARVFGGLNEFDSEWGRISLGSFSFDEGWWAWLALAGTVLRLSLVLVAGVLISLVAPSWLRSVGDQAAESPGWSGLAGLAAGIFALPVAAGLALILLISIVGIPLLPVVPLLLGLLAILWVAGFTAASARLGAAIRGMVSRGPGHVEAPILEFLLGLAALSALTLAAHAMAMGPGLLRPVSLVLGFCGLVVEYVAWTVGLGAVLTVVAARRYARPPAIPKPVVA